MQAANNKPTSLKEVLGGFSPWVNKKDSIYPLNRYLLKRNIAGFAFSEKISKNDAKLVAEKLYILLFKLFPNGRYFKSSELEDGSSQLLFEHLFISNREALHPEGGVFIDLESKIVAIIHLEDHLTIFFHDHEFSAENILTSLTSIDEKMQEEIPFAFSENFGFLTAASTSLGTGLSKEAILHTPAINFLGNGVDENDNTIVHGIGSEKSVLHNLVITTNKYSLGVSEKNIITNVDQIAKKLVKSELSALEELRNNPPKELYNTLSKNFGQILFCKSIEFHEALDIASSIDLGISLGLIESPTKTFYFDLFFDLRRAHLEAFYSNDSTPIDEKRAQFFKEKIKDLKLLI